MKTIKIKGVNLTHKNTEKESWIAEFKTEKKRYRKSFSIKKYGYEQAYKMASLQRLIWEQEFNIFDREILYGIDLKKYIDVLIKDKDIVNIFYDDNSIIMKIENR